ncbi:MAG: hypothetical protein JWQ81_6056 [Amycolatopsis sp.]|uniref:hypothetical protein n=1 Tax=Amycolatopsis sp. TaxID=37632 RepID=UPI00262E947E|nr:hypothetical protein [Amycolatopsis sp.]MCU1685317.1 hypothetical protein [Amycolatopsis sp.]
MHDDHTDEGAQPGRRARNQAARVVFQVARDRGLVRRHAMKLQHLAERGLIAHPNTSPTGEKPSAPSSKDPA